MKSSPTASSCRAPRKFFLFGLLFLLFTSLLPRRVKAMNACVFHCSDAHCYDTKAHHSGTKFSRRGGAKEAMPELESTKGTSIKALSEDPTNGKASAPVKQRPFGAVFGHGRRGSATKEHNNLKR